MDLLFLISQSSIAVPRILLTIIAFFFVIDLKSQSMQLLYVSINPVSKGLDTTTVLIAKDKILATDNKPDNERRKITRRFVDLTSHRLYWISDESKTMLSDKLPAKLAFEQLPGRQLIQGVECKAFYSEETAVNPESKDTSYAITKIWVGEEVLFPALANEESLYSFGIYKGRLVYKMEYEWIFDYDKKNSNNLALTLMTRNSDQNITVALPAGYQTQPYTPQRFLNLFVVLEYGEMFRRLKE